MKAQGQKISMTRTLVATFALFALSLSACTKAKETKSTVSPDAYMAKADFEGKIYSMVRGVEESDSNNEIGATPGMSQDFGFVKVRITDDEIHFVEVFNLANKDETQAVLASFPIKDQFDIEREVNDFGETTNKIIEKRERPKSQRQFMRVDWSAPSNEKSKLPTATWVPDAAVENAFLREPLKIEQNGHISWLTEFSTPGGMNLFGDVANGSRVVLRTHLMPVKETDFVPLNYRSEDFKRFGYFYTYQDFENPEKGLLDTDVENHKFANLHNVCEPGRTNEDGKPLSCSTNKIVWHVTKNYPEKYREITRRVVAEWNDTFKEALGRKDDVVVLDESFEVDMVDPRFNTIAYYGAKSSGGLLGVAQETINPRTGETIASRATVYDDGIRSLMGLVDDIVTLILSDEQVRQTFLATDAETKERVDSVFKQSREFAMKGFDRKSSVRLSLGLAPVRKPSIRLNRVEARHNIAEIKRRLSEPPARSIQRKAALIKKNAGMFALVEQSKMGAPLAGYDQAFGILGAHSLTKTRFFQKQEDKDILDGMGGVDNLLDVGASLREERARLINQASTGVHGAELVEEAALRYIKKVLAAHPEASDFQAQVATLKRDVEQKTFYTTLLHEMGHTFGLRHNFQGSADAKHYTPEFHRLVKQMEAEAKLPADKKTVTEADLQPYMFSSIMDYGGDFYSQLGGIGPYDKAAIRYAYNRSIDKQNDPIVKANYQFCTDHQVNETILCRRFDKGRNVSEITFNLIESYQTNWVLSHLRRNRANFERSARSYPIRSLVRTFIPVRQVMDEFLYSLIDAKTLPAKKDECDIASWRVSVEKGEIANVCNSVEAESVGVDPTDLETFEAALFDDKGLRKDIAEYTPYGLGDLLLANVIAKQFFNEVLGSTEPGKYVALPQKDNTFQLEKLPEGKDLDESVLAFATERDFSTDPKVLEQIKKLVGEVKIGRYGKPFNSEWDETGSDPKQKNIGAFWDKYVAMIALGFKDIGIDKYARHSMTGNAYAFPHTTSFARQMIKSMITQKDRMVTIPFQTKAGLLPATIEPTLNLDVRAIATITALTDFTSDTDRSSMPSRMRVCSIDEQGCQADFGEVKFKSSSGQNVYKAAQTRTKDSIAFELLTEAAAFDKQRNDLAEKARTATDVSAQNIMKMSELAPQRESLEKTLLGLGIKEITGIVPVLLSNDSKKASVWNIVNILASQPDALPLFTTLNYAQQASNILNATAQMLGQSIEALDPENKCKDPTPTAPAPPAPAPVTDPVGTLARAQSNGRVSMPAVAHLRAVLKNEATLQGKAANAAAPVAAATDCAPVLARRAVLVAAATEFQAFATPIGEVLNSSFEVKVVPLQLKRMTDQLERSENNILLIREISKAVGLD